ncbi:MAG: hypothetical protein M5U34_33845 [Chloroflexi bacterium]|nr:hypothetical protein [Chloroflexota bacterium]
MQRATPCTMKKPRIRSLSEAGAKTRKQGSTVQGHDEYDRPSGIAYSGRYRFRGKGDDPLYLPSYQRSKVILNKIGLLYVGDVKMVRSKHGEASTMETISI